MTRVILVSRLRRVIQTVKFMLSFSAGKWPLSSPFLGSPPAPRWPIGFKLQPAGLLDSVEEFFEVGSSFAICRTESLSASTVSRTTSSASDLSRTISSESSSSSSGEDVNAKADRFIENFKHHLQMERQISLELWYLTEEKNLERTISD